MKTYKSSMRFILLSLFMAAILNTVLYAQGTDSRRVYENKDKLYIGILLTPQQTSIQNDGFSNSLTLTKGNSINISVEGAYYFSKFAGISFGAGYNPYSSELSLSRYEVDFSATDSDTPPENYEMQIDGKSITEIQNISFLSIPVSLALRVPAGNKVGFFINAGVSAEIPMVKTYDGSGTFTYDGYYAVYPVTLHNLPEYGFASDLPTKVSEELDIKSFNAALSASGGIYFYLGTSFQIALGAHFSKSLSGISNYTSDNDFYLTTKANELNSIMEGTSKTGIQAMGISLGLRYFIK